jgi:putative IMPACT (imprinted ancient) family translation regulator
VRAYSSAASETLDLAAIVRRETLTQATLVVPHADAGRYDHLLRDWAQNHGATLGETRYGARAELELWVPPANLARLEADIASASNGSLAVTVGAERVVDGPGAS